MSTTNPDLSRLFRQTADLLEIDGANEFRVRAYRRAARTISDLSASVSDMIQNREDLTRLPGIGQDLAEKIKTIVNTGSLPLLEELEERVPPELMELLQIQGLGPKRIKALYSSLNITDRQSLKQAAQEGKVQEIEGFGPRSEQNILEQLEKETGEEKGRILLAEAEQYAGPLLKALQKADGLKKLCIAGSFRRRKETVGDLDILAACSRDSNLMQLFTGYENVESVVSQGSTRATVILRSGLQVDLRVVPEVSYGAALHYFTGSKGHNIALRKLGVSMDLKINEYGVFKDDERIAGQTEQQVYESVGLHYIQPELREQRGEIQAARENNLPRLIRTEDLKGDLHTHTRATDGRDSLEEMAEAAIQMGYEYLAVTDHSKQVSVAHGLDEDGLRRQMDAIDQLNEKLENITLLKGIEVDILEDGSLDLDDSVLELLDLCVCSVHSRLHLSEKKQTRRLLKAMDNPCCSILGHPTGRIIGQRPPMKLDMEKIMQAAKDRDCVLEINAQPHRLDLPDVHIRQAGEMGLKMAVSSDAHWSKKLDLIRYGVDQARRGWLQDEGVINTRSLKDLRRLLRR